MSDALAGEKLFAGDNTVFRTGTDPEIMLTSTRWKAHMPHDHAIQLGLICAGLNREEDITYEVKRGDAEWMWFVERRWKGNFTHWAVPLRFQVEINDWRKRVEK